MRHKVSVIIGNFDFRLDVNNFCLSRAQKKVLSRMNNFLQNDFRPIKRPKMSENNVAERITEIIAALSNSQCIKVQVDEKKILNPGLREKGKKKKFRRRERAFQKMRDKGINIEEVRFPLCYVHFFQIDEILCADSLQTDFSLLKMFLFNPRIEK